MKGTHPLSQGANSGGVVVETVTIATAGKGDCVEFCEISRALDNNCPPLHMAEREREIW